MTEKTYREKLRVIVSHAEADVNLCAVAYQMIKASEPAERSQELMEFITNVKRGKSDTSMKLPVTITKKEEANLMGRYGSYVDQKLEQLLKEQLEENEFYSKLTEFIFHDEMLQDGMAGAIAIFDCMIDKRLPYHKIDMSDALSMSQEEFIEIMNRIGDEALEAIDNAMAYDFDQKTERAGVVLSLIESRESKEERIIMLIRAFRNYEKQIMQLQHRELKRGILRELMEEAE